MGSSEPSVGATTAPTQETPTEEPPVEETPVEEPRVEETPAEEPPVEEAPVAGPSCSNTPARWRRVEWEMASLGPNRLRQAQRQNSDGPGP